MECPAGTRCDPSGSVIDPHGCAPVPCGRNGGWECGVNEACHPGAPGSGCALRSCATDEDCDIVDVTDGRPRTVDLVANDTDADSGSSLTVIELLPTTISFSGRTTGSAGRR